MTFWNHLLFLVKAFPNECARLSPTKEIATEVGSRRTKNPTILKIKAEAARKNGLKSYKATNKVYLCDAILPKYIQIAR